MNWNAFTAIATGVYALFTLALIVTAICGIRITVKQLTQTREQNKIGHLENHLRQFDSPEFRGIRKSLAHARIDKTTKKLKPLDIDNPPLELDEVLNFFEHMALLYTMKYLDLYPIWHTFGYWIFPLYADSREYIEQERKDDKSTFEDFCQLVEDLRKLERERGGDWDAPSPDDKFDFYEGESRYPPKPPRKRKKPRKP